MSTDSNIPQDPEVPQPEQTEEQTSLNAENLDVQELDEKLLDSVAGGNEEMALLDGCTGYSPSNFIC